MSAPAYDPNLAVDYGNFVSMAYKMYAAAPNDPTPPPPSPFPTGYDFHAWVKMKDFIVDSGDWRFYGVMVRSKTEPDTYILAIRGTSDLTEWWDDLTSIVPAPWKGVGLVGYGFNRIYQTLELVEYHDPQAGAGMAPQAQAQSMAAAGSFAHQVAASVSHGRSGAAAAPEAAPAPKKITVVGHSLGSALATLYVAENAGATAALVTTPLLCTFASPRVGDPTFAAAFDALPVASWRIANELDLVPKLPAIGYQHVETLYPLNSGNQTHWSLECWHSLDTYLHLLDPKHPLAAGCSAWFAVAAEAPLRPVPAHAMGMVAPAAAAPGTPIALSVPSGTGATIDITIKVS